MPTKFAMRLLAGTAVSALLTGVSFAAEARPFDIPQQDAATALQAFAMQSGRQVLFPYEAAKGKSAPEIKGDYSDEEVIALLAASAGLRVTADDGRTITLRPQFAQAADQGGDDGTVEALIVTAQKREEDIQDVPIAISAFSQEALERSQIAGGPDLMTQVPNFTFTKTNFTGYSIQIRGIGTQAISATTDPAVAVAFNNTPFIRNRFFEQEFYDLQRVEVLRGPQGTLYGRNATAGVVNIISAKPKFGYEAKLSGDLGNYNAVRLEGMVNFPLVDDMVALRLAGAWTKRDGYATNQFTGNPIDGRDLWSTRMSLRFAPTDALDINLIWEHFEEDDDRIRSGKQLCKKDPNKTSLNGVAFPVEAEPGVNSSKLGTYNQGCIGASLYSPESFQTPNGFALPYIHPLKQLGLPTTIGLDPYASQSQSRDLRVIESLVDPEYRAQANIAELQISWDLSDSLTLQSETAYSTDELFSTQDYNRFITSRGIFSQEQYELYLNVLLANGIASNVLHNGVFCDPQIGCSDRLVAVDLSTAQSTNFSQELRLSSDYDGPFNFSLGANFTRYDTIDKYYVFINSLGLWTAIGRDGARQTAYQPGVTTHIECLGAPGYGDPSLVYSVTGCIYMDPNPIGSLNDLGHNYFLSKNPYRLISYAAFGEGYYELTDNLKITGGLRWTVDKKHAPLIPSWLLAEGTLGYPVKEILDLEWTEPTGRLAVDWQPEVSFTDETLLYASYARGYKAGGANPPPMVVVGDQVRRAGAAESVLHPKSFDAEFVDAFEIGTKNTLFDGRMTLNANVFYYDYRGYQISQIIDRSAVNSNFDAEVWGLELEADWRPTENLRLGFKGGYENTSLADGSEAIDLMDRTAGRTDWVVAKPFPSLASNCILPVSLVTFGNRINTLLTDGSGGQILGDVGFCVHAYIEGFDPVTQRPYESNPQLIANPTLGNPDGTLPLPSQWAGYPGFDPASAPNNGEGFTKDLSGNELPNAPHFTGTLTADYTVPIVGDWLLNLHADLYYQSEAWTRIFNTEGYDKLKAYTNVNLAAMITNDDAGWKVMAYVKNVFDRDSITGAFLNSDDSGLTTNVFLTEPRLYGVRVTKDFSDVPLLGSIFGGRKSFYPVTIELGGGPAHFDGEVENYAPTWLELYSDEFPQPLLIDDEDLDWGDAREVKLSYSLSRAWRVSAAYRFGKTNGHDRRAAYEFVPGGSVPCLFGCTGDLYNPSEPNHWIATVDDREEYSIVDFVIGREVGIGAFGEGGRSMVNAGLRYADFRSNSSSEMDGIPDRYSPVRWSATGKYGLPTRHWDQFAYRLDSDRSFEGIGPQLTWEASIRLAGDDESGHADLDWRAGGGLLFGKRAVDSEEHRRAQYFKIDVLAGFSEDKPASVPLNDVVPRHREEDVTVPTVSFGLGLSYSIDRVKVSTGYSYDRFFDVTDGGFEESKEYDRTIHGPYLKLSLGFGG